MDYNLRRSDNNKTTRNGKLISIFSPCIRELSLFVSQSMYTILHRLVHTCSKEDKVTCVLTNAHETCFLPNSSIVTCFSDI